MSRVLLMADVVTDGQLEAEHVVLETHGPVVSLLLDDGTHIALDRDELAAALAPVEVREAA